MRVKLCDKYSQDSYYIPHSHKIADKLPFILVSHKKVVLAHFIFTSHKKVVLAQPFISEASTKGWLVRI